MTTVSKTTVFETAKSALLLDCFAMKKLTSTSFLALVFLVSFSAAYALEPKQCLTMAAMNEALRGEGQRTIIIGDRTAAVNDPTQVGNVRIARWVNTVTSNADGSLGYNLEGDKPMGQPSTEVCVRAKLTNIRLYDRQRTDTPAEARRGGDFDAMLGQDASTGTRPMLQADSISTGPDGSVRQGLGVTLMSNARSRAAWFLANYPRGVVRDMFEMRSVDYTEVGLTRIR